MSSNIFDDLPVDINDKLIQEFDEMAGDKLSKRKKHVWHQALKWALEREVAYLTSNGYADLVWEDKLLRLKFKDKLFEKFNKRD